jgi:hypothetical protein
MISDNLQVSPPSGSAASIQSLRGGGSPLPNVNGIRLRCVFNLEGFGGFINAAVFWGLTAGMDTTTGECLFDGSCQVMWPDTVIDPSQAADDSSIYLTAIGAPPIVSVSYL